MLYIIVKNGKKNKILLDKNDFSPYNISDEKTKNPKGGFIMTKTKFFGFLAVMLFVMVSVTGCMFEPDTKTVNNYITTYVTNHISTNIFAVTQTGTATVYTNITSANLVSSLVLAISNSALATNHTVVAYCHPASDTSSWYDLYTYLYTKYTVTSKLIQGGYEFDATVASTPVNIINANITCKFVATWLEVKYYTNR
jgi:hypothetical protein